MHDQINRSNPNHTPAPPGQVLQEKLDAIGMSQAELAQRMGRPAKTINGIIKNKVAITVETALQLERVLGVPATFWSRQEQAYREALARHEEERRLAEQVDWVKRFPLAEMQTLGWLEVQPEPVQQVQTVLQFFGVVSPEQWREIWLAGPAGLPPALLDSEEVGGITAWLRRGELLAQAITCAPHDPRRFRKTLNRLRALTLAQPVQFLPELQQAAAAAGVAVAVVPPLPGVALTGATRWLSPAKALLQLSSALDSDDKFWSAFFHQAGHLLLHGKREFFWEGAGLAANGKEAEVDNFAADLLVPPRLWARLLELDQSLDRVIIQSLSAQLRLAAGLIVGRLQREQALPAGQWDELKRQLFWEEVRGERLGD